MSQHKTTAKCVIRLKIKLTDTDLNNLEQAELRKLAVCVIGSEM